MKKTVQFKPGDIVKIINQKAVDDYGYDKGKVTKIIIDPSYSPIEIKVALILGNMDYILFNPTELELIEENSNILIEEYDSVGYFLDNIYDEGFITHIDTNNIAEIGHITTGNKRQSCIPETKRLSLPLNELILLKKHDTR